MLAAQWKLCASLLHEENLRKELTTGAVSRGTVVTAQRTLPP
jgi:hypothetical protein